MKEDLKEMVKVDLSIDNFWRYHFKFRIKRDWENQDDIYLYHIILIIFMNKKYIISYN